MGGGTKRETVGKLGFVALQRKENIRSSSIIGDSTLPAKWHTQF